MQKIWKIYARTPRGSSNSEDFAYECYESDAIAIGWDQIGNLNQFKTKDDLKQKILCVYPHWFNKNNRRLGSATGILWTFKEIAENDYVICPDSKSKRYYIGKITGKVGYDPNKIKGKCEFAHIRPVKWHSRSITKKEMIKSLKKSHFGGEQTLSQVNIDLKILKSLLKTKKTKGSDIKVSWHPDKEWGNLAEIRALEWLGKKAHDVHKLNYGWDIELDNIKYEVKGRKSKNTTIRLTQNEWNAAKKHKKQYVILLFTAANKKQLKKAEPERIANPTQESWEERKRTISEYFLNE